MQAEDEYAEQNPEEMEEEEEDEVEGEVRCTPPPARARGHASFMFGGLLCYCCLCTQQPVSEAFLVWFSICLVPDESSEKGR